jgi:hypothetical protein
MRQRLERLAPLRSQVEKLGTGEGLALSGDDIGKQFRLVGGESTGGDALQQIIKRLDHVVLVADFLDDVERRSAVFRNWP